MKRYRLFWILLFIIIPSILYILLTFGASQGNPSNVLQNFIIGRWSASMDQKLPNSRLTEIEFIKPDRLIINIITKDGEYNNLTFKYHFEDDHKIKVEGRGGDEWLLNKQGEQLEIKTSSFLNSYEGLFERKPTINWLIIAILLSTLVIGSFYIGLPQALYIKVPLNKLILPLVQLSVNLLRILNLLLSFCLFGFGVMLGTFLWFCPIILNVLLPWDAVITLELSSILFILGIRTMRINYKEQISADTLYINFGPYIGYFICGIGFWGVIMSLGKILLFSITGSYPQ
jgi:hypothetical protein